MLDKNFTPSLHEQRLYEKTEPLFKATPDSTKQPYVIMMPPPNVTGSLHLGHALNDTLQDILIRYHRKKGFDVLWQPGTDHAGIATQIVVEKQLAEQGLTRHDLGREAFIQKVWEWKEKSGSTIVQQKRRLCISPDWSRERFTMDEGLSKAVIKVFVQLHKENLIYRAKRLVNWDTKLQTAISDLEVETREQSGHLWYIAYAVENEAEPIIVATTRPETLFADTAVAVHPDDERYQHLIGKMAKLPITGRLIPIIADEYCDPEKGSGAVKITPGHDMNDFEVGKRNQLPMLNMMDSNGNLIDPAPADYVGLSFAEARKKTLLALEEAGQLIKTDTIKHMVPYSERSNVEIQPWLTDQWFVDAETLAKPALEAVESGKTKFFPENWQNTYFEWLRNIQPWCISRQIWWGHQIPAWHGPDGHIFVEENEDNAIAAAHTHYGKNVELKRDTDVLDTWFSSALWPFTTLGWPDQTDVLKHYYPTSVLTTGFDIIFFWVARMMMMGIHFMKDIPFKTVYIHALIRDEKGQKMSKSKGNIIDPLDLLNEFGADTLRFTMAKFAAPGRDVKIGHARVENSRNFLTKIWNAAKFLEMNQAHYDPTFNPIENPEQVQNLVNQWIIIKTVEMIDELSTAIEEYRFDFAANILYQHFWGTFCDIYVECLKTLVNNDATKEETQKTAMWAFLQFLNAANPVMPIMTEYLWEHFGNNRDKTIMEQPWFTKKDTTLSYDVNGVSWLVHFIEEVRSLKGLLGIAANTKTPLIITAKNHHTDLIQQQWAWVGHLARLEFTDMNQKGVPFVVGGTLFELGIGDNQSISDIKNLLADKKLILDTDISHLEKKLSNDAFKNAKPDLWKADSDLLNVKKEDSHKIKQIFESWV